ncbi:hypothetical protein P7L53_12085 [Thermoleptolyngbya sichuanensis XZ-Cy5]|uniref:hypothetical protein n=1 Tax=Thermoleptolyngbya sichuanensis TaxID=2885951 RepID=UPI00240DAFDF|nr:hypothetical protein [Thermoleptolyngbya sichuanensis]MDG2616979.1 hypothetical protein [Thermoleptolyngbya sichuanensis XZ-Cy5]
MTLPENFRDFEFVQSTIKMIYNREVATEFRDIGLDDDGIATPRAALKTACRIEDNDSALQMLLRMFLYYFILRKARDFQRPVYGMPLDDYQSAHKFSPCVHLYFRQDTAATPPGRAPVRARLSYRVRNETSLTITEAELRSQALRIRNEFVVNNRGWRWSKGRLLVTYKDLERGLNLQIYALNKAEGIQVIRKVCDCAQAPYDSDLVVTHESEQDFPANPGMQNILGRSRRRPVRRPVAAVRFVRATASIWGLPQDITLVANPLGRANPLVPVPNLYDSD